MRVTHPRSKPRYPNVMCSRIINKRRCDKPSEFMFGDKTSRGKNIIFGLCEQHSAENGCRHASPEKGSQKNQEVKGN